MRNSLKQLLGKKVQVTKGDFKDEIATVRIVGDDSYREPIGVEFQKYNSQRHDLDGSVLEGFGWWLDRDDFIHMYRGFKIGDRVIDEIGDTGTVIGFDLEEKGDFCIIVKFDAYYTIYHCDYNRLQILTQDILEVGTSVRLKNTRTELDGATGVIAFVDMEDLDECGLPYSIELDEFYEEAHDCMGHTEYGYGWWCKRQELIVIEEEEEDCEEDYEEEIECGYSTIGVECNDCLFNEICSELSTNTNLDYKVGDTVRIIDEETYAYGTVTKIKSVNYTNPVYSYELEGDRSEGLGKGIYWTDEELQLVSEYEVLEKDNIKLIISYPAVIAIIKEHGREFKGVAKCNIDCNDIFDEQIGAEIAVRRAVKELINFEIEQLAK